MGLTNSPKDTDFHELLLIIAPHLEAGVGCIYRDKTYSIITYNLDTKTPPKNHYSKRNQHFWQEKIKEVMAKAKSQNISDEDRCQIIWNLRGALENILYCILLYDSTTTTPTNFGLGYLFPCAILFIYAFYQQTRSLFQRPKLMGNLRLSLLQNQKLNKPVNHPWSQLLHLRLWSQLPHQSSRLWPQALQPRLLQHQQLRLWLHLQSACGRLHGHQLQLANPQAHEIGVECVSQVAHAYITRQIVYLQYHKSSMSYSNPWQPNDSGVAPASLRWGSEVPNALPACQDLGGTLAKEECVVVDPCPHRTHVLWIYLFILGRGDPNQIEKLTTNPWP